MNSIFNTPNEGSLLQQAGCPIAKALPSPPVPSQIASVVCALGELNYAYRTVYVQSNGTRLTRITRGVVGIPTLIDVNGDGAPDFSGSLLPVLSGTALTLHITRLAFPATGKVSVEAIALDPAAPQTYVGAGEDGLTAGTDSDWSATVTLLSSSTAADKISVTQKNSGPPATVGTLGEIFSGSNPDSPTHTARGDVQFTPAPATITANVTLAQSSQDVAVTSSAPARLDGALSLINANDDKEITATADQLGKSVDVSYSQPSKGETKVTYAADAVVNNFSAQYHDTANGDLATAAAIDATGIPTGVTVDQVGSHTAVTTSGGAIGSIEARYGSGRDVPARASDPGPYADYHAYDKGKSTAGVRLPNLQSLTLDAAQPFSGDLALSQPLDYVALAAQDDAKGYVVSGHLKGLPAHSSVGVDFETTHVRIINASDTTGKVTFSGDNHGVPAGIGEIAVDIANTQQALFGRADEIGATIDGIPAADTVSFDYGDNGSLLPSNTYASATATHPIGSISVLASDGSSAAAAAPNNDTSSGLWYVDTKDAYYVFARISQLTSYSVSLTKDASDSIQSLSGSMCSGVDSDSCNASAHRLSGQDVTVSAQTDAASFLGKINELPAWASFSLAPDASGNQVVDYQASAPIETIVADANGFSSLQNLGTGGDVQPTLDRFHSEIDGLPSHITLTMKSDGGASVNTYGDHIGHVLAQLYSHTARPAQQSDVSYPDPTDSNLLKSAPSGDQLVDYDPAGRGISIDVHNVGGFEYSNESGVLKLRYDLASGTPLALLFSAPGSSTVGLEGRIEHPQPGALTVTTPADGSGGTADINFAADSQSSNLTGDGGLGMVNLVGNVGVSTLFKGSLGNVPANLDVCLDYATGVEDCGPPWVYSDSQNLGTDNPPQLFAIHVLPTDLNGAVPSAPLTFSGEVCFSSTTAITLHDCDQTGIGFGGGPPGVFVNASKPLTFDSVWLAMGQRTDDCHASDTCGRAWLAFDTTNDGADPSGTLSGSLRFYTGGDKDPLITFNTDTGGYIHASDYYLFVGYNLGLGDPYEPHSAGTLDCGTAGQQSMLLNAGPGIDLLTNTAIGACQ